jgi:hypothetical protein
VALDGLKYFSSRQEDRDVIPPTLIINRGLASVKKTANQLYPFPLNYLLLGAAKLCGWAANPEQEIVNFLETPNTDQLQRKVVIIETPNDFYFSEKGAFDPELHQRITEAGALVFRAGFHPFLFHPRAHHAVSLDNFVNNCETEIKANTASFPLNPRDKVTSMIAREIFLSGDESCHTCFLVCGNLTTLDTGTILEALPLMSAFEEEAEKVAQNRANWEEQTA